MRVPATICPAPCKLTFDLESGVRVTCDVAYLCGNFSLPRPLCSRLRPDVRDRQTDVRRASSLNAPYPRGGSILFHALDDVICCRCVVTTSRILYSEYGSVVQVGDEGVLLGECWLQQHVVDVVIVLLSVHSQSVTAAKRPTCHAH